ncbi:MAG TPA: hypothetical protein VFG70_08515 [Gaiellaceae bacterium]|nr:hypothetical protein [Gaiellaceae bacterium]
MTEDLSGLAAVHRERDLVQLEDLSVEQRPSRDPRRTLAGGDENLYRRHGDERLDESLGVASPRDLLVLVDDDPRVWRPVAEVLSEDLGERIGVLGRCGHGAQVLAQPLVGTCDERRRRARETQRQGGDVPRGAADDEPRALPSLVRHPMLGEGGLAVARRGDEQPHTGVRGVQQRVEPVPLDDPPTLESGCPHPVREAPSIGASKLTGER